MDDIRKRLAAARGKVDRQPGENRAKAGNYRKGHLKIHGLRVSVENPRGSTRRGKGPDGKPWARRMPCDYGYIKGTVGKDGDQVDVYVGPHPENGFVLVIDQVDALGAFDEHKVVLGCRNEKEARELYRKNYPAGWKGLGHARAMTIGQFKKWLETGSQKQPVQHQTIALSMKTTEEEQIAKDRRALAKGAAVAGLAGAAGLAMLLKHRRAMGRDALAAAKARRAAASARRAENSLRGREAVSAVAGAAEKAADAPLALPRGKGRSAPYVAPDPVAARRGARLAKNARRNAAKEKNAAAFGKRIQKNPDRTRVDLPGGALPVDPRKWAAAPEPVKRHVARMERAAASGSLTPAERKVAEAHARAAKQKHEFAEKRGRKRDGLDTARDLALTGAGVAGVGAAGYGVRAMRHGRRTLDGVAQKAGETLGKVNAAADAARQAVAPAAAAGKAVGKAAGAGKSFAAKLAHLLGMRRRVNLARRDRVTEFGGAGQMKDRGSNRYSSPLLTMAGYQKSYVKDGHGNEIDIPAGVLHGQTIKEAYNKGKSIQKWSGRAAGLGRDVLDVARGKPRQKDASGRTKKREWEKSWFKNAAGAVAAGAALAGGARYVSKRPHLQKAIGRKARKVARSVNSVVPDLIPVREFSSANPKILGQREKLLAALKSRARMGGPKAGKAAKVARRVAVDVRERKGMVKAAGAKRAATVRGLKKTAAVAGAGALAGGAVMKAHSELPETRKRDIGTRVRNTLVGATAGGYLGGMLHGGASGYKGARVGAALGGTMGLLTNPKRKVAIEELPTASFADEDYERHIKHRGLKGERWWREGAAAKKKKKPFIETSVMEFAVVGPKTAGKVLKSLGYGKRGGPKMVRPKGPLLGAAYVPKGMSREMMEMRASIAGVQAKKLKGHSVVVPREPVKLRAGTKRAVGEIYDPVGIGMHEHGHASDRLVGRAQKAMEKKQPKFIDAINRGDMVAADRIGKQFGRVQIGLEKRANRKVLEKVQKHGSPEEVTAWRRYANKQMKAGYRKPTFDQVSAVTKADTLSKKKQILRELPHLRGKYTDLSRKGRVTWFDAIAADAGWDVRDPRGRSARVFAPGSRRRVRREKEWYERVENQRKLAVAGAVAAGLAGAGLGAYAMKRSMAKTPVKPRKPRAGKNNVVPGPAEWKGPKRA